MSVSGEELAALRRDHRLGRAIRKAYRGWGFREAGCSTKPRLLAFLGRALLTKCGVSAGRILVMNCGEGRHNDGFYAQFTTILGLLEHVERWPDVVVGVRVDFGDWPLYYDAPYGSNPWEYYFQPIDFRHKPAAVEQVVDFHQGNRFAMRGENMSRAWAAGLIEKYIRVKPHIRLKVDTFARQHFADREVFGVHYRGTDKWKEAPRVPYEEVRAAIRKAIASARPDRLRLFVASDERAFVDFMQETFPGRVVCWETLRSSDGSPIDFRTDDNYRQGEDAMIDCLLLSRCSLLLRTASNLSLCSGYFNPDIPVTLLNRPY